MAIPSLFSPPSLTPPRCVALVVQVTSADLASGKPLEALNGKALTVAKEGGVRKKIKDVYRS